MKTTIAACIFTTFTSIFLSAAESGQSPPIPFSDLGAQAAKQYSGDGVYVTPQPGGALLRAAFQDLEADATAEGLWLRSSRDGNGHASDRFRVRAGASGREGGIAGQLPSAGAVRVAEQTVSFQRPGMTEEYSVSMDGVRQDFLVAENPAGEGRLSVALEVSGARVSAASYGAKLVLDGSGREIAYHRLHVTDATGRQLDARMEVSGKHEIRLLVDDRDAVYPVRIDPTFCDCDWISMGGAAGVEGWVYAIAADAGGNVYVGGTFTAAGGVAAANVAKWNGSSWSAMGDGISGTVYSLAVSGSLVYAGGSITGGVTCWNGHSWSPLREGVNGTVVSLAVSGGKLYVGGNFTMAGSVSCNNIALWFGGNWSALGAGTNGAVAALAVSGSELYVGGSFDDAAGVSGTSRIAKWNGTVWSSLGGGMDGNVNGMTLHGGYVYACGQFNNAGGVASQWLARWNIGTASWQAIGVPPEISNSPGALAVHSGELYLAAYYGVGSVNHTLAKWNLTTPGWSYPTASPAYAVHALGTLGGSLYAGGAFSSVGDTGASSIARLSGSTWSALGTGFTGTIQAITSLGTDLYVGGTFTSTPDGVAQHIAKWNGSMWSALGSGTNARVCALVTWNGSVYAAGEFTEAGGLTVNHIARWNPATSSWSVLQPPDLGSSSGLNGFVYALAASPTQLYVGGSFTSAGGVTPASSIASWNGTSWSALGGGVAGSVSALAVSGGDLFASGLFSSAGGVTDTLNIAKWNGSAWNALGSGANSSVDALAVSGSNLYAGGYFTEIDGVEAYHVARWNGSAWSALGPPTVGLVRALAVSGTDLYVGTIGSSYCIAKWDSLTSEWSALGSGVDDRVNALAVANGRLFVGGSFGTAGGKFSPRLASIPLAVPSDGSLDETFGTGGKVVSDFGGGWDSIRAMMRQPDGKIVAAGWANTSSSEDFALARYDEAGSLDLNFGTGGKVTSDFGGLSDAVYDVVLQPDGRIVAAGHSANGSGFDFALVRYEGDGSPDLSFGMGGKVTTDFGGNNDHGYAVVLQPDGRILVAGSFWNGSNDDFALARYEEDGSPDLSFGTGGKVTTDFGGLTDVAYDVLLQPDGRIVVAGYSGNGSNTDFAVVRYEADGSLDSGFGIGGKVATDVGGFGDFGRALALQSDGRILVAGFSETSITSNLSLVRYEEDGSLDLNFGTGGKVTTGFGAESSRGNAVALQPDGRIVVAGFALNGPGANFALARYEDDGSLDLNFGTGGKVTTDFAGGHDRGYAVILQPDGRIVMAGEGGNANYDFALARYAWDPNISLHGNGHEIADGDTTPDPLDGTDMGAAPMGGGTSKTFSIRNTGRETLTLTGSPSTRVTVSPADGPFSISAISLIGSIPPCDGETSFSVNFNPTLSEHAGFQTATVTVRSNDDDEDPYTFTVRACGIAPVFSDGRLDPTFDTDGKVLTTLGVNSNDFAYDAAEQADGKIVVVGSSNNVSGSTADFLVARYMPNGSLDPSFGTGGIVTTPISGSNDSASAVRIQTDGKILVAGSAIIGSQEDFALCRYLSNGTLDPDFGGGDGIVTTDIGGLSDIALALALQDDGLILVAGRSFNGSSQDFAVVRYLPNGVEDPAFGAKRYEFTGGDDETHAVLVQDDGMIVLAGTSGADFALLRLDPWGVLDPAFGSFGRVTTDFGGASSDQAFAATFTAGGNILVAGTANGLLALARYLPSGTLDPAFGTSGKTTSHSGIAYDVALQPDGKIITGGWYYNGVHSDFLLARFSATGTLDSTLDGDGIVTVNLTGGLNNDTARAVIPTCDGNILLAGYSTTGLYTDIALTRHSVAPMPEIRIEGNLLVIPTFDTTPRQLDHTDFGSVGLGETLTRTFTIRNIGTADLHLTGGVGNLVSLSPPVGTPFTVSTQPTSDTIIPGGLVDFEITFAPTAPSHIVSHSVAVVIPNDDFDEAACQFNVSAWGARFSDGTLDETFGTGGMVIHDYEPGASSDCDAMAVQRDGKILIAGNSNESGLSKYAISRFNTDGTLDSGFGVGGTVVTYHDRNSQIQNLHILEDGNILAVGITSPLSGGAWNISAVRYDSTGNIDFSFGSAGRIEIDPGPNAGYLWVSSALQADDKIVIVSSKSGGPGGTLQIGLLRLTTDGAPDTSFGAEGWVTTDFGTGFNLNPEAIVVQENGRIVVSALAAPLTGFLHQLAVSRYHSNGELDTSFDSDGRVMTQIPGEALIGRRGLIQQPDGKLIVSASTANQMAVVRYLENGGLDTTGFGGGDGIATFAAVDSYLWNIALQSDGGIVLAGFSANPTLARLLSDGSPDVAGFGVGLGFVTTHPPGIQRQYRGMCLLPDGRIAAAGLIDNGPSLFDTTFLTLHAWSDGEIAVSGNGVDITDGDTTPATVDHSDFGSTCTVSGSVARVFTITNSGPDNLNLTGSPRVAVSGDHAANFTVTVQPSSPVADGASTTFTLTFDPAVPGLRSAMVSIACNDPDEHPFTFAIQGTGLTHAEVFEQKMLAAGLTGGNTAPLAMPFGDGVSNLLKYAFNLNLNAADVRTMAAGGTAGLPRITLVGSGAARVLRYEFVGRADCLELTYTPKKSTNLAPASWLPLTDLPTITPLGGEWARFVYEEPAPEGTSPQLFGRVVVEMP